MMPGTQWTQSFTRRQGSYFQCANDPNDLETVEMHLLWWLVSCLPNWPCFTRYQHDMESPKGNIGKVFYGNIEKLEEAVGSVAFVPRMDLCVCNLFKISRIEGILSWLKCCVLEARTDLQTLTCAFNMGFSECPGID